MPSLNGSPQAAGLLTWLRKELQGIIQIVSGLKSHCLGELFITRILEMYDIEKAKKVRQLSKATLSALLETLDINKQRDLHD